MMVIIGSPYRGIKEPGIAYPMITIKVRARCHRWRLAHAFNEKIRNEKVIDSKNARPVLPSESTVRGLNTSAHAA
ncbi:MAG: hypothetical protein P8123_02595 [bacterium]